MARLPPALSLALAVLVACGAGPRVVAAELVVGCAWDINSRCSSDREVFCGTFETDACVPIEVSGFPLFGKITAVGNGRYSMGIALSESACDQDVLIELIPAGAKGECFPIEKASIITVNLDFGLLQDSTATAAPSTTSIAVSTPCPPASPANCRQGSESFCTRGADGCQRCSCRLAEVSTTPAGPLATKVTGCIYGLGSGCTGESQGCADYEIDACTVQEMNSIDVYLLVTRGEAPGTYNLGASLSAQSCSNGLTIPVVAGAAVGDCSAVEKISFLTVNLDIGLSTFVDPEASTRAPTTDAPATSAPGVDKDCREDSNCKNCDGASGRCEKCGNFMYLHQGECIAACPTTLATWGVGKAGLECVAPFTCSLADGCECPLGGCEECEVLAGAGNVQCLSCDASRYLVAGKCKKDVFCRGTQFDEEGYTGSCHCRTATEKNCFACSFSGGPGVNNKECSRCKNQLYLQDGVCVAAQECRAPSVPAGAAKNGRVCTPPFTCKSNKALDGELQGKSCGCPDAKNCAACTWGENGASCIRCRSKKYLLEGKCVDECPAGMVWGNSGASGRFCSAVPFECTRRVDSLTGAKCKCSDSKFCAQCAWEVDNGRDVSKCLKCSKGRVAQDGVCVKA